MLAQIYCVTITELTNVIPLGITASALEVKHLAHTISSESSPKTL